MTIVFGDSEWQDAIDTNPAAIPDVGAVNRRLAQEIVLWKLRGQTTEDEDAAEVARKLIVLAVLQYRAKALEFVEEVEAAGSNSADYQALDEGQRQTVRLIVGLILVWLISEHSLI